MITYKNQFRASNTLGKITCSLANLDLFISADTACVHLAGALGIKSYLLIPYCSDWRWFDNDKKTEWYDFRPT